MAKRKELSKIKKFAILGVVLCIAEGIYIFSFSSTAPAPVKERIKQEVAKQRDLSAERRAQLEIQLAVMDYQTKHSGKPPKTLKDLVPDYFDKIPTNPKTGDLFKYALVDGRPVVGEIETTTTVVAGAGTALEGTSQAEQELLIQSVGQEVNDQFVYDPAGKRDPFLPYSFSTQQDIDPNKSPLEQYDLGQLKLTAVLKGFDEPMAIVENDAGKGFSVKKGMKIGNAGGEVVDILPDKLLILESLTDFTGQTKTRTVEMKLRTSAEDEASKRKQLKQRRPKEPIQ